MSTGGGAEEIKRLRKENKELKKEKEENLKNIASLERRLRETMQYSLYMVNIGNQVVDECRQLKRRLHKVDPTYEMCPCCKEEIEKEEEEKEKGVKESSLNQS
jgi:CRISPR/Cas system-associated endoribonuclease Cas2